MDVTFSKTVLLIMATPLLMASGCNKNGTKPCALTTPYSFAVTSEFTPQKAVYNVGDTIFLTSTFPKTLTNLISNQQVDYGNSVGIAGDIEIVYPDSVTRQNRPAKDSFELVSAKGSFMPRTINQNQGTNFKYSESSQYEFRGGIVCKKKGLYAISVYNLSSNGLAGKDCTNAGFTMTVTNTQKNIDWYQNALNIILGSAGIGKIYCFKVQ